MLAWIAEGIRRNRQQWHNLKCFTWVKQQGKVIGALNVQLQPEFWEDEQDA